MQSLKLAVALVPSQAKIKSHLMKAWGKSVFGHSLM